MILCYLGESNGSLKLLCLEYTVDASNLPNQTFLIFGKSSVISTNMSVLLLRQFLFIKFDFVQYFLFILFLNY